MENLYLIFVIILFILAVSDLVVGISNDAANFVNSSVGSKAAPMVVILTIAGLGVLLGATFSSGMMEIARSGVFYPGKFLFTEIMIIFLAVMITDVIMLDTFNTFGLPTSTTVSIVFELLGASVAISLIKISNSPETFFDLGNYINSGKALAIISGILISVVLAFTFGSIVQFITRFVFTFNYQRNMKYFGAPWGGIAITAIVYFILVKGAKGASFMTEDFVNWLHGHTWIVLLGTFAAVSVILQLLISIFRINILRIIVLAGTFSLAMAFAGNDLVNFIGVPLAGFESYREFAGNPDFHPDTHTMESLMAPVKTPTTFLLAAGAIMVLTLFLSKKARTVSQTEISLARQDVGAERFASSVISRSVVRSTIRFSRVIKIIVPEKVLLAIEKRFNNEYLKKPKYRKDSASFDLLRASVNMFVASILIATGTSLKLPLSTTYVTFMVAMGSSLTDRAWGRESAVYRITGVLSVIGGWFMTALTAFTGAFLVALFLYWGGLVAAFIALAVALIFVIRTNFLHKKFVAKHLRDDEFAGQDIMNGENLISSCNSKIQSILSSAEKYYASSLLNLINEDRKKMRKLKAGIEELDKFTRNMKLNIYPTFQKLDENHMEAGYSYLQILDQMREISSCLKYISEPIFEHLDNNHPPMIPEQVRNLHELNESVSSFFEEARSVVKKQNYVREMDKLASTHRGILDLIARIKKRQIKLVKNETIGTRNTLLYLSLLSESRNLVLYIMNLLKLHHEFTVSEKSAVKS